MSATTESPRRALPKLRRNRGDANASTNSLASGSGDGGDDSSEGGGGLRASFVDATLGKIKDRARPVDHRPSSRDGSSKRLSSLIPGRKKSIQLDSPAPERKPSSQSGDSRNGSVAMFGNHSESSLLSESRRSSLLTDDNSDIEGKPIRPTLSPHQSHAGYLTLSSPEINAQAQPVASANKIEEEQQQQTFNSGDPSTPHIVEPTNTEIFPPAEPLKRSPSPAGRLAGAFGRIQAGGDTDSVKSASGAGGIGSLFRPRGRAGSLKSQKANEAANTEKPALGPDVSAAAAEESQVQSETGQERPETPQQAKRERINTTSLPATPPNLVETTPTTLVTPPTPTDPNADTSTFAARNNLKASPPKRSVSSVESIRHRRAQSANLPSKLSNSIPLPLTPTVEETKTPGGTLTQPSNASGFFSSFLSAAQKAADQLSQNINTQSKSKPATPAHIEGGEEVIPGIASRPDSSDDPNKQAAVDTLGKGNLSLSHLGIDEHSEAPSMPAASDLAQQNAHTVNGDAGNKAEEEAAARAVSAAYEKPVQNVVTQATGRPLSTVSNDRLTLVGEQTPPRPVVEADGLARSGSVRSRLSGRRRRHRASSATTGTAATGSTIAAAIQSSAAALSNPATGATGHRLTGFAVASSKRNKDFHQLFRSVPEDDYLIEDYSAALQRDILLHGRLYVSESHICFSSNILGWVTTLVISFDEVVSIEKKSTAVIFPNAIVIQTLQARNTFASFVARDSTYELLVGIWKISHPNLRSSLNGVTLDNAGTGDKTEVVDPEDVDDDDSADGSDDEVYDEDEDDDVGSFTDAGVALSVAGSDVGDVLLSRKTSAAPVGALPPPNGVAAKAPEGGEAAVTGASSSADYPGPQSHTPTECGDQAEHYATALTDSTIPAPIGKVYSMIFGPASGAFMKKWLVEDQKSRELNWPDGCLDNDHKTFVFDYIKPLNAPVGPRQTRCITTNTLVNLDLEKAVTVDCSTQTPDVPSGNIFVTKTRYCLMWGPGNTTRMIATCVVEWSGKSWLRGPIEKGANDGQTEYIRAILAALKAAVVVKPVVKVVIGKKGKRRSKKDSGDAELAQAQREAAAAAVQQKPATWGLLEPLRQILEPLLSIIRPFITSQVIIAVLLTLLVYSWFLPSRGGASVGLSGYGSPERIAAYEEIWRREESDLWDWLEDRVGLDHLHAPASSYGKQKGQQAEVMRKKLENERMSERQMDDAIKVTEERLAALKDAVARDKKGKRPKEEL